MAGSAVRCVLLCALMLVNGSGSPMVDKARLAYLYRAIHLKFSLILYNLRFAGQSVSFFLI